MTKKQLSIIASAIAMGVSTNIYAQESEVNNKPNIIINNDNKEEDVDIEKVKEEKTQVENEVANLENDINKLTEDKKEQEKTVSEKESEVNKSEKLVENATNENITAKENEKLKVENTVKDTEKNAENLKNEIESEKSKEESISNEVTALTNEYNNKEDIVNNTNNELNSKKENLANLTEETVNENLKNAETNKELSEKEVEKATTNLETAKENDNLNKSNIENTKNKLDSAKETLKEKELVVNNKETEKDQTKSELDAKKEERKGIIVDDTNSFTFTDEWIDAFKAVIKDENKETKAKIREQNKLNRKQNEYKPSERDLNDSTTYDVNNLPEHVKKELSIFVANLMNQIRQQVGNEKVMVSESSIEFADLVSNKYHEDNYGWEEIYTKSHYGKAINEIANLYGLPMTENLGVETGRQYYENANIYGYNSRPQTMRELKEFMYQSIKAFVMAGDEWEHAKSIAGFNAKHYSETNKEYIGVDVSSQNDATIAHVLLIGESYLDRRKPNRAKEFSTEKMPLGEELREKALMLDKEIKTLEDIYNKKVKELNTSKTEVQNIKETITNLDNKLKELKSAPNQTEIASRKLELAKEDLKQKEKDLEIARKAVADLESAREELTNEINTLEKKLNSDREIANNAKIKLNEKISELNRVKENIKAKEVEFENVVLNVTTLKKSIKDLESEIANLKDAPKLLEKAKLELEVAKKKLEETEKELSEKHSKLKPLKIKLDELTVKYNKLNEKYNKNLTINIVKESLKKLENTNPKHESTIIENDIVEIVSTPKEYVEIANKKTNMEQNVLPKTGIQTTTSLIAFVLSGIGLLGLNKKRKR